MKKISIGIFCLTLLTALPAWAGGLLTNTNQHIDFVRMMARGASLDIDAVYSNPAGTAWMRDGWTLSLNNQSAFQERDIDATFPLFTTENHTRHYDGKASAPIIPSLYAVFHKNRWAVQGFFGMVGGGGKCSFDDGLPMFDAIVTGTMAQYGITPDMYGIGSAVTGRQYIFGGQLGFSYRFNDHFSGHAGFRANYFSGNYEGYVVAGLNEPYATALGMQGVNLVNMQLDCDQTGWGITPVIGVNYRWKGLTLAAKYEFKTNLNIENDTKQRSVQVRGADLDPDIALGDYKHGVNTPSDIPSYLAVAVGYEFTPRLRAALEYHFFDDKNAEMAGNKQKALSRGTNEVLAGVEFDMNKYVTLSCGAQRTDYGLEDDYQSHTSFSCDSWSVGLGGAVHVNGHVTVNVGYFWTMYQDYDKHVAATTPGGYCGTTLEGHDTYSRSNKVFGIGVDYKF